MAAQDRDTRTPEQQAAVDNLRTSLASGFAFVRSREATAALASYTYEESVSEGLRAILEDESDVRLGKLSLVRALKQKVIDAVERASQLPDGAFELSEGQGQANTTAEGDGPSRELNEDVEGL